MDYNAAAGDHLAYDVSGANVHQFKVVWANTTGSGRLDAQIVLKSSGQVLWVLRDAEGASHILVQSGSTSFDLLA